MKKFFTLLTMCVLIASMAMAETTITFDASVDKGTYDSSNPGADQLVKDDVTAADVNGDGIVDIFDVNEVVNFMLGKSSMNYTKTVNHG